MASHRKDDGDANVVDENSSGAPATACVGTGEAAAGTPQRAAAPRVSWFAAWVPMLFVMLVGVAVGFGTAAFIFVGVR